MAALSNLVVTSSVLRTESFGVTSERVDAEGGVADPARRWSQVECAALFNRIAAFASGGGDTVVTMRVSWLGTLPWAHNRPLTATIICNPRVVIRRVVNGKFVQTETTQLDDASLKAAVAELEHRLQFGNLDLAGKATELPAAQPYLQAPIWSETTFNVTEQGRADAAQASVRPVQAATLLAGGTLETRVETWAIFNTKGLAAYATGTMATYAQTVRTPDGTGSGWAGLTQTDWAKLDIATLAARALQKCVASASPRAIEPGRYMVILEPQVVSSFFLFAVRELDRQAAEAGDHPYAGDKPGTTKIGQRVFDERITISTDPRDPDCPYLPFDADGWPYRPVTWVENGVLKALAYDHQYAQTKLQTDVPLPNPHAYRMSGGPTSIDEMIATTERGVLVSHTTIARRVNIGTNLLVSASTRDGVWLIEQGKLKAPIKNMQILESPLAIGNNVLQLGKPEPVFGGVWLGENHENTFPPQALGNIPIVVPPLKVRDFRFSALADPI